MPTNVSTAVVRIEFERLGSGYVFASSPDVAGLYLVGDSEEKLSTKIIPAIKQLYKLNRGLEVEVTEAADPAFSNEPPPIRLDHIPMYLARAVAA